MLWIEDRFEDVELGLKVLKKAGFTIECDINQEPEEIAELLANKNYDVVLADYQLDTWTGLDAFEMLQKMGKDIPFIMITGALPEATAAACISRGIFDYVLKDSLARLPVSIRLALVNKALREERARAERKLRDSEERYRLLFESNPQPAFVFDLQNLSFVTVNEAATRQYGYSREEFLRMSIKDLQVSGTKPIPAGALFKSQFSSNLPKTCRHRKKDGTFFEAEINAHTIMLAGKKCLLAIANDITQRKQAEEAVTQSREQLRSLAAHLQSIREEERTRISREVHDVLGQSLTSIKLDLAWISNRMPESLKLLQDRTKSLATQIDATIQTVRKIATELRPSVLDTIGLVAAIEWQAGEFQSRTGIRSHCVIEWDETGLDTKRCTAIFRIFQETLTNVARHARATRINVILRKEANYLMLQVCDDGRGISDSEISKPMALGLLGMKERALLSGGEFQISGAPDEGTKVVVKIPLGRSVLSS